MHTGSMLNMLKAVWESVIMIPQFSQKIGVCIIKYLQMILNLILANLQAFGVRDDNIDLISSGFLSIEQIDGILNAELGDFSNPGDKWWVERAVFDDEISVVVPFYRGGHFSGASFLNLLRSASMSLTLWQRVLNMWRLCLAD